MDERSWTAGEKSPSELAFPPHIEAVWSCIGLARGYPLLRVDGYDLDPASVELARRNIAAAGLADRVRPIGLGPAGTIAPARHPRVAA